MAYEYDRFEREEGGGSFLMGLLAGTVLGAGLGMLFAPKAGSELRSQLSESATKLPVDGGRGRPAGVREGQPDVDRGREAYDRARSSVSNMAASTRAPVRRARHRPVDDGQPSDVGGSVDQQSRRRFGA